MRIMMEMVMGNMMGMEVVREMVIVMEMRMEIVMEMGVVVNNGNRDEDSDG